MSRRDTAYEDADLEQSFKDTDERAQPANLQGIWNDSKDPPWDSKWTVNINTEMNYWPAELTGLSECHEPLFAALADLSQTGARVAKEHYNARGWVVHHNFDLWRGAAPINDSNHGIWPTGGAWLCEHLWYRYAFTGDEEFLRDTAYPLMKGAALFFVDTSLRTRRQSNQAGDRVLDPAIVPRLADQRAQQQSRARRAGDGADDGPSDHPQPVCARDRGQRNSGRR